MKTTVMFTTTISQNLLIWLDQHAKKQKITKRLIIEEALKKYRHDLRQQELANSFKKAARDLEIISWSEEGLIDYNKQLKDS